MSVLKTFTLATAIASCLLALLSGCSPKEADENAARSFTVQGFVESVSEDGTRLMVDHEEIPDFMPAMIMQFQVADPAETAGLQPGEQIQFRFLVEPTRSWIEDIEKTGRSRDPDTRNASHLLSGSDGSERLQQGEALPDYAFLDEDGQTVRLSDYRGSVVAITFIFTRCPVPEYCPAMMRNFGNVDAILKDSPPLPAPWKLVTISFDPEYDTPEAMKRYGEAFDYDPETWDLLTSRTLEPIEGIAANVGLKFGKSNGSYLHNLRTVVLDPQGRITRTFTNEDWSPEELAAELLNAAGGL